MKQKLSSTRNHSKKQNWLSSTVKIRALLQRCENLSFNENALQLPRPPTVETLLSTERKPPLVLLDFPTKMIHSTKHNTGKEVTRLVDSFGQDIIHAILRGSPQHDWSKKMPIQILPKLGHSSNQDSERN